MPQGYGFGAFTVHANSNAIRVNGRTADAAAFVTAGNLGEGGQVLIYAPLYGPGGYLAGVLTTASDHSITGAPFWKKPVLSTRSRDKAYAGGFGPLTLTAAGGGYTAPTRGQLVMGLTPGSGNAKLAFTSGGLGSEIDQTLTITNPRATGLTNTAAVPANDDKIILTPLTAATGAFGGSFTIEGATTAANRKAPFSGQIVTTASGTKGYGYFLLPQPATGNQTVATAPKNSGVVQLTGP